MPPDEAASRRRQEFELSGHLKPGRTLAHLAAELDGISARLSTQYPDSNRNRRFAARDAHRHLIGEYNHEYVTLLFWAVLFVLLIACVNIANLQFARATSRLREVAVRTALGASRGRIVAQLLTESVLLSLAGAAFGLAVAAWGIDMIRTGMPPEVERYVVGWSEMRLDGRALLFTMLAALGSGVLAGLVPAWQSSRPNLTGALKEGGRTSAGRSRQRLRNLLVAAEIALAVVLLVGASLMARGFGVIVHAATSIEPATLMTFRLALTETKYRDMAQRHNFYREVLNRAAAIPGVKSAVAATALPFSDHSSSRELTIEGKPADPTRTPWAMYQSVTPGYFETLHIGLRAGRLLGEQDGANSPKTAVVSRRMAERYWPGEPLPIGKHIKIGPPAAKGDWITIVGVVDDLIHQTFERYPMPTLYVPYFQTESLWMDVAVRTTGDPNRYGSALAAAVRAVDPEQPVTDVHSMDTLIHNEGLGLIYVAILMGVFGVLALVLSCVGVYGVMAYLVQDQTHEIGVRMALGAQRDTVLTMILKRGLVTAVSGMAVGLVFAFALARLMQNLIWGVPASDIVTFAGIPMALIAAASFAILIPARRATKIDPIVALRYE
jgi:putative ABC transport system permease protein